jgi:3-oxoacyl-[acyl-carrier protein] reductase
MTVAIDLTGTKVLIVGGGGGGIGRTCTRLIGAAGATVAVVDIDKSRADEAADEVIKMGGQAFGLSGDVSSLADIERVVAGADDRLHGIDSLVTIVGGVNAFNVGFNQVADCPDEDWDKMFEYNVRYVFRLVRSVINAMLAKERGGSVVSIGSYAGGQHGAPMMGAYGAAKSAVAHLAMTIAAEYGPLGIRMNVVSPGWTATPIGGSRSDTQTDGLLRSIPLRRRGVPEDIANAVLFLLSPLSSYISGQILGVDGGASASSGFLSAGWT